MALESMGTAAVGKLAGELTSVILNLGERAINFNPVLQDIKSKLNAISPLVKQIVELNEDMDYPKEETEKLRNLMNEGKQLLIECGDAKLENLNRYLKRPFYTQKLRDLDSALRSFMDVLMLQMARDQKKNLKMMNQLMEIICRLDNDGSLGKLVDSFAPPHLDPQLQEETVGIPVDLSASPCQDPVLGGETFGLDEPVKELKVKFFKNGNRMVVVTALGGGGKTTLALKFCRDQQVKDIFEEKIFFVSVSREPVLKHVLKSRIQSLRGVDQLTDFENEEQAFCCLELWLKQKTSQKPILIVLDDVWAGSESEKLLEKLFEMPHCKVLVTSRFSFPRFGEPFYLKPLNHEDALKLFQRSSFPGPRDSDFVHEALVEQIVRGCKRLPLALRMVGRSLSRKPASDWYECESIFDSERVILRSLQMSLNELDGKRVLKESFMDLGSFPEDQRIPASTFIDMCAVLYGQDEAEAMVTIGDLSSRSLVYPITKRNDASDDDDYNEFFFTQHGMLRELAIYLMDKEPIHQRRRLFLDVHTDYLRLESWSDQQETITNAHLVSLTTGEELPSHWPDMEAPEVELLILNLQSSTYNLPAFINKMNKLKALIITNYSTSFLTQVTTCDCSLTTCSSLQRIRLERISVPPFSNPLINLRKISFFTCKVGQAFADCLTTKISDLLANLLEISFDSCDDLTALPNGLCEIVFLEKLSVANCHGLSSLPEEMGELINLRTLRLRSCIYLEELPESIAKLAKLVVLDVSHCHCLTKLPKRVGELQNLEKLDLRRCRSLSRLPWSVGKFMKLKILCDRGIREWLKKEAPHLAQ